MFSLTNNPVLIQFKAGVANLEQSSGLYSMHVITTQGLCLVVHGIQNTACLYRAFLITILLYCWFFLVLYFWLLLIIKSQWETNKYTDNI